MKQKADGWFITVRTKVNDEIKDECFEFQTEEERLLFIACIKDNPTCLDHALGYKAEIRSNN